LLKKLVAKVEVVITRCPEVLINKYFKLLSLCLNFVSARTPTHARTHMILRAIIKNQARHLFVDCTGPAIPITSIRQFLEHEPVEGR